MEKRECLLRQLLSLIVHSPHEPSQWGRCKTPIITGELLRQCEEEFKKLTNQNLPKVPNNTAGAIDDRV